MKGIKVETKEINGETWLKFDSEFDKWRYYWSNTLTLILIIVLIVLGISLGYIIMNHIELLKSNPCGLCRELGFTCIKYNF